MSIPPSYAKREERLEKYFIVVSLFSHILQCSIANEEKQGA